MKIGDGNGDAPPDFAPHDGRTEAFHGGARGRAGQRETKRPSPMTGQPFHCVESFVAGVIVHDCAVELAGGSRSLRCIEEGG